MFQSYTSPSLHPLTRIESSEGLGPVTGLGPSAYIRRHSWRTAAADARALQSSPTHHPSGATLRQKALRQPPVLRQGTHCLTSHRSTTETACAPGGGRYSFPDYLDSPDLEQASSRHKVLQCPAIFRHLNLFLFIGTAVLSSIAFSYTLETSIVYTMVFTFCLEA